MQTTKHPRVGQQIRMPADRGGPAAWGRITHVGAERCTHPAAPCPFVWVTVLHLDDKTRSGVWPSHRLGFHLPPDPDATPL